LFATVEKLKLDFETNTKSFEKMHKKLDNMTEILQKILKTVEDKK
jgi:chaperonin cofactor prefoldin